MDGSIINEPQQPSQLNKPSQAEFKKNYEELLAGVNRIRYIKTKQKRNQTKIMQYLSSLSKNIQNRKENKYRSAPKLNNSFKVPILNLRRSIQFKQIKNPFKNSLTFQTNQNSRIHPTHKKLFHYSFESIYKNTGFDSKPTQPTISNPSIIANITVQSSKEKLAQLLSKKKINNYHEMKQLRLKNQEIQREKKQASIREAQIRRQAVKTSYENGRKRINQHYFQHLESIKQAKVLEKERKLRQTEKNIQQLIQLQKIQQEQLEKFQQSLIMESNLKELIQMANNPTNSKRIFREINNTIQ